MILVRKESLEVKKHYYEEMVRVLPTNIHSYECGEAIIFVTDFNSSLIIEMFPRAGFNPDTPPRARN